MPLNSLESTVLEGSTSTIDSIDYYHARYALFHLIILSSMGSVLTYRPHEEPEMKKQILASLILASLSVSAFALPQSAQQSLQGERKASSTLAADGAERTGANRIG